MSHSGASDNPYRYTGQQFDALTGLYSLRARYYDPALGRFLSRDVFPYGNPVELNRYTYAAGNPVNFADPSGNNFAETAILDFSSCRNTTIAAEAYLGFAVPLALVVIAGLLSVQTIAEAPPVPLPRIPEAGEWLRKARQIWEKHKDIALTATLVYLMSRTLVRDITDTW